MSSALRFASALNHHTPSLSPPLGRGISTNTSPLASPRWHRPCRSPPLRTSVPPARAATADSAAAAEAVELPEALRGGPLPTHVAIIMDGNSRWARARGMPTSFGHEAGYQALKKTIVLSRQWGIRALTVFAFSAENWTRPKAEVGFLMTLFESVLKENVRDFMKEGIRVCIIGDTTYLPKSLQKLANEVVDATKNNTQFDLIVAISYSGRKEITQACRTIAQKVKHGLLEPEDITESHIEQELETKCILDFPSPDLLIRTSGELRLSNFLLWQSAYTELFFTETFWPDFEEQDYIAALSSFQSRKRRFGQRIA